MIALTAPLLGYTFSPLALAGQDTFNEIMPGQVDGILGAYVNTGGTAFYAGYLYSRGVFTNIALTDLKAFAMAAVSREFAELSYLKAGLDRLAAAGKDAADTVGRSTAFVRSLRMFPPVPNPQQIPVEDLEVQGFNFLTAHLQQTDIAKHFGLGAAMNIQPEVSFYEGHISWQTEGFKTASTGLLVEGEHGDEDVAASFTLGVVNMPNMYYYGVEGGRHPSASLEVNRPGTGGIVVRVNDPEFLSAFPYAHNAIDILFRGGF